MFFPSRSHHKHQSNYICSMIFPWISPMDFLPTKPPPVRGPPPTALRQDLLFHRAHLSALHHLPTGDGTSSRWVWGYDGILSMLNLVKCYIILYNEYMMRILSIRMGIITTENDGQDIICIYIYN